MKNIIALIALSTTASAFAAGAVVDGKQQPFNLSDGASIQANLPVRMSNIVDYSERTMGAIFKSNLPCSATDRRGWSIRGGVKVYSIRTGTYGAKLGCERLNGLGHSLVIWDDGSDSFMMKDEWAGFIPNYMR